MLLPLPSRGALAVRFRCEMLTAAVIGAWIAIALLGFALAATRREIASLAMTRVNVQALVHPSLLNEIALPKVVAVVKEDCEACSGMLRRIASLPADIRSHLAFISRAPFNAPGLGPIAAAPDLVGELAPAAIPWLIVLDRDATVVASEPFTDTRRLERLVDLARAS